MQPFYNNFYQTSFVSFKCIILVINLFQFKMLDNVLRIECTYDIALFHKKYVFDTCDFEQINVARRNEQSQQNGFFLIYWHIIYVDDEINKYFTKNKSCFSFELELYQTIVYARAFLIITLSYD